MDRVEERTKLKTSKPKLGRVEALKPGTYGHSCMYSTLPPHKGVPTMMMRYVYPTSASPSSSLLILAFNSPGALFPVISN